MKYLTVAILLALISLGIYVAYPIVTRPDTLTLFFNCVDDMDAHEVPALESMSFCGGILKEEQ